jgi:hypothetical protein
MATRRLPSSIITTAKSMVADIETAPGSPSWLRLARLAKLLSSVTLVWLSIEGAIGVVAGVLAGSIALVAFGLDSAIEGLASVIVIWRFTGSRTISADAERRAQKWVAISFFLLAPYVAAEAIETLIEGAVAETSRIGIALTAGTLVICRWLGRAKQRIAEKLGSRYLRRGDAKRPMRDPCRCGAGRAGGQHAVWSVVARSGDCARDLRDLCARRAESLARRGMRLRHLFLGREPVSDCFRRYPALGSSDLKGRNSPTAADFRTIQDGPQSTQNGRSAHHHLPPIGDARD